MRYYSLADISKLVRISLPTLYKYKRVEAVPGGRLHRFAFGSGKKMIFREDSLPVFRQLKLEGVHGRGRNAATKR